MKNILDIRPEKIKVEGRKWDDDDVQQLAARGIAMFRDCLRYWQPLLDRGRRLEDYFEGKILTSEQRAQYDHDDKIVIEPAIMKAPIRALIGQAMKSRKSGQVVTERNAADAAEDNSKELETINIVMKDMEIKTSEEFRITDALASAFVSCYWNVLMFDKDRPSRNSEGMRYKMTALPWGSCVFGPITIREPDGSDIKEMFRFDYRTIADLLDNYPDMEKQIADHFDSDWVEDGKLLSSIGQWGGSWTAAERDEMFDALRNAHDAKSGPAGLVQIVEHLFPVKKKEDVWVNIFDDTGETFEIRPPDWDDERWNMFLSENPHLHGPYERETIVLWMTTFTTSGLVLANREHWFQKNGMLPCSFWVGAVDGNKPTGPAVDMAEDVLANCVAEIEYLDDLRKGSGRLLIAREGAIVTTETLHEEANKAVGIAFVSKDYRGPINDAIQEMVRQPNSNWKTYAEQRKGAMAENTRINEALQGSHAPRQSAIAKENEISQAMTVNARYMDNFNRSMIYHQNLKLALIPYFYDQHEAIEVMDEKSGEMQMVEVNAPESYDAEGNVASVINDLTAHRYKYKVSLTDNSPNAKLRNLEDGIVVINGVSGPLLSADPSGMMFAKFLASTDNTVLKEMGRALLEQAQQTSQAMSESEQRQTAVDQTLKLTKAKADLIRATKSGVFTNFKATDLSDYPGLYDLWIQLQEMFGQKADAELAEIQQMVAPQQPEGMPEGGEKM